jgi:hypothetical protein
VAIATNDHVPGGQMALGWVDGNPMHMCSTTDASSVNAVVARQVSRTKEDIPSHECVKKYYHNM